MLGNLYYLVRTCLEQHSIGRVFLAAFDVVFTSFDVVEPDLLYMSNARAAEILTEKHVTGAPDIVVRLGRLQRANVTRRSNAGSTNVQACRSTGSSIRKSTSSASIAARVSGLTVHGNSVRKPTMS